MLEVAVLCRLGAFTLDIAFRAQAQGITAVLGRSGAGKTTLVNAIAGLVRPERGRIVLDGTVLFDQEAGIDLPPERRRIGYVFQEDRLFPHLSVKGNLRYGLRQAKNGGRVVDFDHVTAILGLGPLLARHPGSLSGGEKQRVAIGRALLTGPRLLLMDEPLAGLDPERKAEVLPFIERLRDELEIPVLYVSHIMEEIVRLADTVVLVSDGRLAATGSVEEVMSRLDLRPLTGRYEGGAVLNATILDHDEAFGLTRLAFSGGELLVPRLSLPPGERLRLRIRARDVALALEPPRRTSILNVLPGRVREIASETGALVDVVVDVGAPLWARITARSLAELGLAVGSPVYALVKAVAIDGRSLGGRGRRDPNLPDLSSEDG
ncbi:MAG: molybdenum ABC transporter ATP-binding protein [Alphaproteobacteria bacterium]